KRKPDEYRGTLVLQQFYSVFLFLAAIATILRSNAENSAPMREIFLLSIKFILLIKSGYMKNISVIGAGTMGNGIAHVFAQNGFKVTLVDISLHQLNKALETIGKNCDRQVAKNSITEEQKR